MYDYNLIEKFLILNPDVKLLTVFHSQYEKFRIMGIHVDLSNTEKSFLKIDFTILFRVFLSVFMRWVVSFNQVKMLNEAFDF